LLANLFGILRHAYGGVELSPTGGAERNSLKKEQPRRILGRRW